jgi:hypothetical protein
VLARLQEEEAVESAEVDRRGELLRLRLRSSSNVSGVVDLLSNLGFAGEVVVDADVGAATWYGLGSVGELSREEAKVIAQRVVPLFAQQAGLGVGEVEALKDLVATALHACFIAHTLEAGAPHGALNSACGRAVQDAALQQLGPERAVALGNAIQADLAKRAAFKE